jgi:hypothetical protein
MGTGGVMKARTVSFYIESTLMPEVLRTLDEELLPHYLELPHFLGLVVLESQTDTRPEVVGMSLWNGALRDCDDIVEGFLRRLYDVTGTSATRKRYEVLRLVSNTPLLGLEPRGDT